jgi:hypothetical protein
MKFKKTLTAIPSVSADKTQDKIGILDTTQEVSTAEIYSLFQSMLAKAV